VFRRRGFTLIELLIVVAIIAILALIAVPNFLEAQVRAKVSRAKADMRSLANAWEAYHVDWNCYPRDADNRAASGQWWQNGISQVTTPIAYITSAPDDPFFSQVASTSQDDYYAPHYEVASAVATMSPNAPSPWGAPDNGYDCYCVFSIGPNLKEEFTDNDHWPVSSSSNLIPYDPTNGTISIGDLTRMGGQYRAGGWKVCGIDWRYWSLPFN